MDFIKEWIGAIGAAAGVAAMFYSWLTSRSAANSKRLDTVEEAMSEQAKAVAKLEQEFKHLPDKDMVQDLKLEISKLAGTVDAMGARFAGLDRTVQNIDTWLRKEPK